MQDPLPNDEPLFPELDIKYSSRGSRIAATLIDGLIEIAVVFPVTFLNVTVWKIPYLFIVTSVITICYKPLLEYRYGATLGKMAMRLRVVGHDYQKVTGNEVLRRVSFYIAPALLQAVLTIPLYFSSQFKLVTNFQEYSRYISETNPASRWISSIVFVLITADVIAFYMSPQKRALHDVYAGTYVIERT